jgi:hypothetical protein
MSKHDIAGIPEKILIGSIEHDVRKFDEKKDKQMVEYGWTAMYDHVKREIIIKDTGNDNYNYRNFMHECCHGILQEMDSSLTFNESFVTDLSQELIVFFSNFNGNQSNYKIEKYSEKQMQDRVRRSEMDRNYFAEKIQMRKHFEEMKTKAEEKDNGNESKYSGEEN